ncbi:MAG: glucosaminidase domain-containing protein [Saprospiraceae bacterium]
MKIKVGLLGIWIIFSSFYWNMDDKMVASAYIDRFAPLAIEEMHRAGIPASIKLAQAMVESNMGRSVLASQSNNHFGIKCKSYWKGQQFYHKDDDLDTKGRLIESCFRAYNDIESSFKDHSEFLKNSGKYDILFSLDITDYKGWAWGLKSCGYATDNAYALKLIQTIEDYKLYRYDTYQSVQFDLPVHNYLQSVSEPVQSTID